MIVYDDPLTEADFATFRPNGEVVRYLEETRERLGLQRHEMNVLDWGSGRGDYVAWLRDAGYNAFGAEIRQEAAERGKALLQAHGHDYARVIAPILPDVTTTLPANFFHFVFTHYVLEHVADIDAVTREIARVTAPGGCGFHVYPGKLRPIEPHLFMPFVHWLPKNPTRKWMIAAFVACGIEPRWGWLATATRNRKAQAYYEFCNNETYYRSFRDVRRSFAEKGFAVTPVSADHPSLRRLHALPAILRKRLVEWPVMLFQTVEILVSKPQSRANVRATGRNILLSLLAVLGVACLLASTAHAQGEQPAFRRGIGISHIMAWVPLKPGPSKNFAFPPFSNPDANFARELKALRRTGFDFVRFAVDPGPFLQWRGERYEYLTQKLIGYVHLILSHDLSVIVDFHPSDMHPDYLGAKIAAGADAPLFNDYLRVVAQTAAALNELQSSRIALEIMNEPPIRAQLWRPMRDAAYSAVRKAAPKLMLVLDGAEEGNLEGTIALDTYRNDQSTLFSFHYYRPWQFTHQGMTGMAAEYLTDVPYPAVARSMQESFDATLATLATAKLTPSQRSETQTKARRDLESYRASGFGRPDITVDFDKVARWAREHSIPPHRIILGEFGAMNNAQRGLATRQSERLRWLSDVREEAEAHGFAWAAWVHSGSVGFSLLERDGGTELDSGTLRALGFE